jgi:hypothetical protein
MLVQKRMSRATDARRIPRRVTEYRPRVRRGQGGPRWINSAFASERGIKYQTLRRRKLSTVKARDIFGM